MPYTVTTSGIERIRRLKDGKAEQSYDGVCVGFLTRSKPELPRSVMHLCEATQRGNFDGGLRGKRGRAKPN
jgi:hypothetical protein